MEAVFYPGLKSNPGYQNARKQMRGFGAMISFRMKGTKANVVKFIKCLKVFGLATSLGGIDSLVSVPAFMSHASVPIEQKKALGIVETLFRISVGIECL